MSDSYCLPALALLPLAAFSVPLIARAVCAALDFATEAPKIKGNEKTTCLLLFLTHATHVAGSCQGTTQTPAEETNERDNV